LSLLASERISIHCSPGKVAAVAKELEVAVIGPAEELDALEVVIPPC
jgi:hypothetical protein